MTIKAASPTNKYCMKTSSESPSSSRLFLRMSRYHGSTDVVYPRCIMGNVVFIRNVCRACSVSFCVHVPGLTERNINITDCSAIKQYILLK